MAKKKTGHSESNPPKRKKLSSDTYVVHTDNMTNTEVKKKKKKIEVSEVPRPTEQGF